MELITSGKCMTVFLSGEIDHHTAADIRKVIDEETDKLLPQVLVLDFSAVTFMDSSGVGLILGRYKTVKSLGGKIFIFGANYDIERLLMMSGVSKIAEILGGVTYEK